MIFLNVLKKKPSLPPPPLPHLPVNEQPFLGPGNLILSTFINMRGPSLKQGTWFFPFYLFSFQDIDDMPLSNVQFSEMDDTSLTGSSRKSCPGLFT